MTICKTVGLNNNKYTVIMTQQGAMFFSVYISTTGANRQLYTPKIQAAIMAVMVEQDHDEALRMEAERVIDAQRSAGLPVDEEGNDLREWTGASIQAAHAEALEMNITMDRAAYRDELISKHPFSSVAECAHAEALEMNKQSAQEQAVAHTVARKNSLTQKIGLAFAGAAMVFSSVVSPVQAEVVPSYPVDASRMSLEGSVAVSIDCQSNKVDVIRESTSAKYFSKQVKKQVRNICYGQIGTLDRVYVFKMNKVVGAHDMMVNDPGRWLF